MRKLLIGHMVDLVNIINHEVDHPKQMKPCLGEIEEDLSQYAEGKGHNNFGPG